MRVMVQMRTSPAAHAASMAASAAPEVTRAMVRSAPGFTVDAQFAPVQLPGVRTTSDAPMRSASQPLVFSLEPQQSTYLVRGAIPDGAAQASALQQVASHPDVVAVYADPLIETFATACPGSPPIGNATDVARLLETAKLKAAARDGRGVLLAIVDTGINAAHLKAHGVTAKVDAKRSWVPAGVTTKPGQHPVDHGTMCAFDAAIAAPAATLLDIALLQSRTPGSTAMAGLLSDAVAAYAHLRGVLLKMTPGRRALVVSNSWGMFSPRWDFPPGHAGNYSDNPQHPFNLMVASLEADGADILFAAGNCGRDCPDRRCAFGSAPPICGANSHPAVLSIAGVDVKGGRAGYSSQGPGRLDQKKPDLCGYTHFAGSGVYPSDGGTSAACPVAAGVVAAMRTKHKVAKLSPLQMRTLVKRTSRDLGGQGFDFDHGWGVVDAAALLAALP